MFELPDQKRQVLSFILVRDFQCNKINVWISILLLCFFCQGFILYNSLPGIVFFFFTAWKLVGNTSIPPSQRPANIADIRLFVFACDCVTICKTSLTIYVYVTLRDKKTLEKNAALKIVWQIWPSSFKNGHIVHRLSSIVHRLSSMVHGLSSRIQRLGFSTCRKK